MTFNPFVTPTHTQHSLHPVSHTHFFFLHQFSAAIREEISAAILDGARSCVFVQTSNRSNDGNSININARVTGDFHVGRLLGMEKVSL